MATTIQFKRGSAANVAAASALPGEPLFTLDTGKLYVGDGVGKKVLINPNLGTASQYNVGLVAGEIPVIGVDGKLDSTLMPDLAITDVFVVNSEVEMLALTAQTGDVAIRTDINKSYILQQEPASVLSNWIELQTGGSSPVTSVNGEVGNVILVSGDIDMSDYLKGPETGPISTIDNVNLAFTKVENGLAIKASIESPVLTGEPEAPTPAPGDNSTRIATTAFITGAISSFAVDGGTF